MDVEERDRARRVELEEDDVHVALLLSGQRFEHDLGVRLVVHRQRCSRH